MLSHLMHTPVVLPLPDRHQPFESSDALFVYRHRTLWKNAEPFFAVARVWQEPAGGDTNKATFKQNLLRSHLTASHDTVMCYAIEFANDHGIDTVYDASGKRFL